MPGGITISQFAGAAIGAVGAITVSRTGTSLTDFLLNGTPGLAQQSMFRPPQWNKPALTMITVPASGTPASNGGVTDGAGNNQPASRKATNYVFDAVFRLAPAFTARATKHPVQTGANKADNIVVNPSTLRLEIGMSDAIAAFAPDMWTGNASKSIAALQAMLTIMLGRSLVTISTRLHTFSNMALLGIFPDDTSRTRFGLRMVIEFEEILLFDVAVVGNSARPNATDDTALGTVQPTNPPAAAVQNNKLPNPVNQFLNAPDLLQSDGTVVGAGAWSSNPTSLIPTSR